MKGYQDSNILYVFDATPGEIPYVSNNVTIIYVQQEQLAAWKTANSSYASLMQPYNYKMMVVNKLPYSGHTDDDIVFPTHNITVSSGADYITVASTAQYTSTVTITPKAGYTTANVNVAAGDVQVTAGAESWTFTMPDADVTVAASIDTHTITLTGDTTYVSAPATSYAGQTVTITPADLSNFNDITLTADGIEITKNDGDWTFTMPDANVSVAVAYVEPQPVFTQYADYDSTTKTITLAFDTNSTQIPVANLTADYITECTNAMSVFNDNPNVTVNGVVASASADASAIVININSTYIMLNHSGFNDNIPERGGDASQVVYEIVVTPNNL